MINPMPSEALMARLNIYPTQVDDILSQIKNELELTEDFCGMLDTSAGE